MDNNLELHINRTDKILDIFDRNTEEKLSLKPGRNWVGKMAETMIRLLNDEYNTNDLKLRCEILNMIYSAKIIEHDNYQIFGEKHNYCNTSSKYPLIFVHVPKTAGSSVNDVLEINNKRTGHKTLKEIQNNIDLDIYNKYTKFSIIRNPFDRMVSLYSYRIKNKDNWVSYGFPNKKRKEVTFEWWFWNFDIHLHMISSPPMQSMSCYDCLIDNTRELGVDYALRFEYLEEDWNNMFEVLDLKAPKLPNKNKSKHKHYSEYYNCSTGDVIKSFIEQRFHNDFKHFGYKFED